MRSESSVPTSHENDASVIQPHADGASPPALRRVLEAWLARLRFDDLEAEPEASAAPHDRHRSYVRLPGGADSEAWLIRWPAGSCAPLHDHGRARGVAAVLRGELAELRFLHDTKRWTECRWQPGAIIELAPRTRHEVHNRSSRTAYSVHVYSPRLDSITYYERTAVVSSPDFRRSSRGQAASASNC